MKTYTQLFLASVLLTVLTACGGSGGGGGDGGTVDPPPVDNTDTDGDGVIDTADSAFENPCIPNDTNAACQADKAEVDQYLGVDLPVWDEFAYEEEFGGSPKVDNEGLEQDVEGEDPVIEDILDGDNLTQSCTTQRVSFAETPDEYVMFGTPSIIYPGALVQGASVRDGDNVGDLLPLNIDQRDTVTVSIPACVFAENFEETLPTQAGVSSAIGAIVNRAEQQGVDCINAQGSLKVETYSSENERALKVGISGKYLNYSGSASLNVDRSKIETTVAAIFRESLFTATIQAPQVPSGWFSDEFTSELLQEQIDLDRIGPDNVSAYVAEVTYGRLMMFTMTSEATEESMRAHINFKYSTPVAGVSADITAEEQSKVDEAKYTAAYIGENPGGYSWLQTLDWTDYFGNGEGEGTEVSASDAVPISIVIKNTRDDTNAFVQELTEYDRTTCIDQIAGAGTFEFGDPQNVDTAFSIATGKDIVVADINGDRNEDVIWAATTPSLRGEIVVALANGDGTFTRVTGVHPEVTTSAGDFRFLAGDVDDDGRDDLVINLTGAGAAAGDPGNFAYVFFYKPDGTGGDEFVYSAEQDLGGTNWSAYEPKLAQMDGQRGLDLVWNTTSVNNAFNDNYIAHAVDMTAPGFNLGADDLFVRTGQLRHQAGGNWTGYEYWHVGDFNGDGKDDFVWQDIDVDGNRFYLALGTDTGLDFGEPFEDPADYYHDWAGGWSSYIVFAGDVNGDGRADLIQPRATPANWGPNDDSGNQFGYYVALGRDAIPHLTTSDPYPYWSGNVPEEVAGKDASGALNLNELSGLFPNPEIHIADVDGNGRQDLILTQRGGNTNDIAVGLGVDNEQSFFDFSRVLQEHDDVSQGEWGLFDIFFGNIDGDDGNNRDDVLWISDGEPSTIYTGRSRPAQ